MEKQLQIELLDSTLREGAQSEGISFSVADKLAIAALLDDLGVEYIEAGNPYSNPKDAEFFAEIASRGLTRSRLVAFGSTRRKQCSAENDEGLAALAASGAQTVTIFGKCSRLQVEQVLNTTAEENLAMIYESCLYLSKLGREVFFDAEHFFSGYIQDKDYALKCLEAARDAGASRLVLCDTCGGSLTDEIKTAVEAVCAVFGDTKIGIHCHNDGGLAVANTIAAAEAGARHVQGTLIGIGERCGNASLSVLIATLQLKLGYSVISDRQLALLSPICRAVAETCNLVIPRGEPYIGLSAFAHKAGMHADAVLKSSDSFEHIRPELVGNERRILLSEMSGRSAIADKIRRFAPTLELSEETVTEIMRKLKRREHKGYQYEGAEASFELMVRRSLPDYKSRFELVKYRVSAERPYESGCSATATVKLRVGDEVVLQSAEGDGPVNALDKALRRALAVFYPELSGMHLIDYKVRVMDSSEATASIVRVLISSSDGKNVWTTVGVSVDIIEASFKALCDSVEYCLLLCSELRERSN